MHNFKKRPAPSPDPTIEETYRRAQKRQKLDASKKRIADLLFVRYLVCLIAVKISPNL
jgi:hypothetical protein